MLLRVARLLLFISLVQQLIRSEEIHRFAVKSSSKAWEDEQESGQGGAVTDKLRLIKNEPFLVRLTHFREGKFVVDCFSF